MMSFSGRVAATTVAAATLLLLVSGCAGRADVASSQTSLPTPTATQTPVATPAPSASRTPTPTATPEPTATEAPIPDPAPSTMRCDGSDLSMEYRADPDASGAGNGAFDLVLTNTSSSACTLAGIPGVYATDADGNRISAVAGTSGPNPDGLLDVVPGAQADIRVLWHSPGAYGCAVGTSAFLVAEVLDSDNGAVRAPASIQVCTDGTRMMDAMAYTLL